MYGLLFVLFFNKSFNAATVFTVSAPCTNWSLGKHVTKPINKVDELLFIATPGTHNMTFRI